MIQYDSYQASDTQLAICSMEYIYFARLTSQYPWCQRPYCTETYGAQLAWGSSTKRILWSVVPNSSSRSYGICRRIWSAKWNGHSSRTSHITSLSTDSRIAGARGAQWLSLLFRVLSKANVLQAMIDDSIVRGTTLRRIVRFEKAGSFTDSRSHW